MGTDRYPESSAEAVGEEGDSVKDRRAGVALLLGVAAVHVVITCLITYPVIALFTTHYFGHMGSDVMQFTWNFWWVKEALLGLHQSPLYTPMLFHPTGVSLVLHDMTFFWSLLSIPFQWFAEPGEIVNGFMLASFPLNGLAAFYLVRRVTGSTPGAFAASVIFAYNPYFLSRLYVGHVSLLGAFFIPLFLLMLWQYGKRPAAKPLLLCGLFTALTFYCHYYYGAILFVIAGAWFLRQLYRSAGREARIALVKHALLGGLVVVVMLGPLAATGIDQIARGDYSGTTDVRTYKYYENGSADLVRYFVPDTTGTRWRGYGLLPGGDAFSRGIKQSGNPMEKSVYPGWVAWLALITGLTLPAVRRRYGSWFLLAFGMFAWTLGPTLFINGERYLSGLLPLTFLADIPILNILVVPTRFALFVALGAGVVLAGMMAWMSRSGRPAVALVISLLASLVACLEFAPEPPNSYPRKVTLSEFHRTMSADDERYAVLDIPADFHGGRGGASYYGLAQVTHGKRLIGGYVSKTPGYVRKPLEESPFLKAVHHHDYEKDRRLRLDIAGLKDARRSVESLGIRYVIVHKYLLPPSEQIRLTIWLNRALGAPVYEDQLLRVYPGVTSGQGKR